MNMSPTKLNAGVAGLNEEFVPIDATSSLDVPLELGGTAKGRWIHPPGIDRVNRS